MRIVVGALILGLASCALVTSAKASGLSSPLPNEPVPKQAAAVPLQTAASPTAGWTIAGKSDSAGQFHEGAFVYIPPPTPRPASPNFHSGSYIFVVSEAGSKGRLVPNQTFGLVPVATARATETVAPSSTASAVHTPTAIPKATPTPSPTSSVATAVATPPLVSTPTCTPTVTPSPTAPPAAVAANAQAATRTIIAPAVDDLRFYRGSFVYDPTLNKLLLVQQSPCCSFGGLPAAAPTPGTPAARSAGLSQPPSNRGAASVLPAVGKAMYYNPGIMDQVVAYRLKLGQVSPCPECVGYAALLRRGDLNRKIWIQWAEGDVEGPFLVVDVAASQHVLMLMARQWVVDVDYATAMRRAMSAPQYVTVLDSPPAPDKPKEFILAANTFHTGP